jgi:hypothetical protein
MTSDAYSPERRIEKKYIAREDALPHIMAWVSQHPARFREHHPTRWVNNLYFDSYEYTAYDHNLAGISRRAKMRFRWYGARTNLFPGTLELKLKRNDFGWKEAARVESAAEASNLDFKNLIKVLRSSTPSRYRYWIDSFPCPVLANRYSRRYFISANENIRVTIDKDLMSADQRFNRRLTWHRTGITPRLVILEVKVDRLARAEAAIAVGNVPIRGSRFSKYVNGIQAISSS